MAYISLKIKMPQGLVSNLPYDNKDFLPCSKRATTKDVANIHTPGNINRVNNMVKLGIASILLSSF